MKLYPSPHTSVLCFRYKILLAAVAFSLSLPLCLCLPVPRSGVCFFVPQMPISCSFHPTPALGGLERSAAFPMLASGARPDRCRGLLGSKLVRSRRHRSAPRRSAAWRVVRCDVEPVKLVRRKFSPYLESVFLPDARDLVCHEWKAVPDIWKSSADKYGDRLALVDPYHEPPSKFTYKELEQAILNFSQGLRVIGIEPDEKLALFADNSCRWLVADQGIMATGAINVVRGTRSSDEELLQIYKHSGSVALIIDNPQYFNRLVGSLIPMVDVRFIIILWGGKSCLKSEAVKNIPLYDYSEIIKLGEENRKQFDSIREGKRYVYEAINPEDVATLMYTSGSSGTPKGVMLTHQNLLHQIKNLWDIVPVEAGDRFLSMLPSWHAYERAVEYFIFTYGSEQMYTNIKSLREDLKSYRPQYLISVPLVYETLYSSIQKQISAGSSLRKFIAFTLIKTSMLYMEAKRIYKGEVLPVKKNRPSSIFSFVDWLWARALAILLWPLHKLGMKLVYCKIHVAIGITKAGISGGASLPNHIDRFFEAIGVMIQNGYGLTETSPVVAAQRPYLNVVGTVGNPLKGTEFKIIEPETGNILPDGLKGIIKVKGPQVMKGYYKNPVATSEALDEEGWLNTGDIGWIAPKCSIGRSRKCGGLIVIDGRTKDTIVLRTGENVEPAEIEAAAMRSSFIQQIMIIGQDQRLLGALIVPNKDELLALGKRLSIQDGNSELDKNKIVMLLQKELGTWTAGFPFQIGPILVLDEPFTIENGLMTPTMKVRRNKVVARYRKQIENLYK